MQARTVPITVGLVSALMLAPAVQAIGFGDMFNPGRWFGGGDDDYYYDEGPYGPPGPYGPYGGPYGAPGYGAPYGAPGYGAPYGGTGYGYPTAPGYAAPGYSAPAAPSSSSAPATESRSDKDREIEALKRRIEQLESRQAAPPPPPASAPSNGGDGWPSAPAFRPMDQY